MWTSQMSSTFPQLDNRSIVIQINDHLHANNNYLAPSLNRRLGEDKKRIKNASALKLDKAIS